MLCYLLILYKVPSYVVVCVENAFHRLKESVKKCCESICENALIEDDWKIGKTKVFLKVLR